MAVTKKAAPPVETAGVNFGEDSFYVTGGGIPNGQYALEFIVKMHQGTDKNGVAKYAARLGVMVMAHSLSDPEHQGEGKAYTEFYSMGTDAHKSYAPNAETGKSLVPVPGGPGGGLPSSTNFAILRKSLVDSGLPSGIFVNDISVLDGIHVVMMKVKPPEERSTFASKSSSEVGGEERSDRMISVVSEILDDGKPWEGTGGIPAGASAPVTKAPVKAPTPIKGKTPPSATPEETESADEADVMTAASSAAVDILNSINPMTKKSNLGGMLHLTLRTGIYSLVKKTHGEDMAQAVASTYFASTDALNELLNPIGYSSDGKTVSPA
jgi:hypothetical protein